LLQPGKILALLKETFSEWSQDHASRLAAALSYYALLSLAPLLLVMVAVVGLLFGEEVARQDVVETMSSVVGPQGVDAIQTIAKSAHASHAGPIGSLIGFAIALFGASGAFVELQASLNTIWDVGPKRGRVVLSYLLERAWSFVMVLGVAMLLLCSLLSSAVLSIVGEFFEEVLPGGRVVWQGVNFGISLGIITLLFAIVFKMIPDAKIAWSDVWIGSFATGLLFVIGNLLLGIYLGKSGVTSSFGGAGSIVALMIWVYYSAQLVFLGAEFTQVYARRVGSQTGAGRPASSGIRSSRPEPSAPSS
jgi:membrane protein